MLKGAFLLTAAAAGAGLAALLASCGDSVTAGETPRQTTTHAEHQAQAPKWPEPRTIAGDADSSITLERPATRIAVVSPAAADLLLDLGITPVVVPAIQFGPETDTPDRWSGIPTMRVSHGAGPSLESLAAASPDLIVTTSTYARATPAIERTIGVPVITLDVNHIADLERHARVLAEATDADAGVLDTLLARLETQRAKHEASSEGDPVRIVAIFGGAAGSHVFLDSSYLASLVELAGGELVANDDAGTSAYAGLAPLSIEEAVVAEPELVLVVAHGDAASRANDLANHAIWSTVPAVRNGHVVALPDAPVLLRPGTDVQQTLDLLREAIASAREG